MGQLEQDLKSLLSAEDEAYLASNLKEENFFKEVLGSLKGPNKAIYIMTWIGIMMASSGLIFCVWKMFQVETTRDMIFFGAFAVMLNSAQIALKLWFNMRLNRQAIAIDIKRLQLAVSRMVG